MTFFLDGCDLLVQVVDGELVHLSGSIHIPAMLPEHPQTLSCYQVLFALVLLCVVLQGLCFLQTL